VNTKKAFPYASEKSVGFTTIIKLITFIIIITILVGIYFN